MKLKLMGIPLTVWGLVAAFGGGIAAGYNLRQSAQTAVVDKSGSDGVVYTAGDPMSCVDLYCKSVFGCNHMQYQYCVMAPMERGAFEAKVKERLEAMRNSGLMPVRKPVRSRTDIKQVNGTQMAFVHAVSPWSGNEEKYEVVAYGQGWKIVDEK